MTIIGAMRNPNKLVVFGLLLLTLVACGDDSPADGGGEDGVNVDTGSSDAIDGADSSTDDAVGVDGSGAADVTGGDAAIADTAAEDAEDAAPDVDLSGLPRTVGGDRPAKVVFPRDYNPANSYPLIVLLHGYGATGQVQDLYLGMSTRVNTYGYILVVPDGTLNSEDQRYWNATLACCSFGDSDVDDVAYISGLVAEVSESYNIDSGRVYTFGHSNGGFMSYRLACDAPGIFTAIVSLAGATLNPDEECEADGPPVSVLQIHGTDDETIEYGGGTFGLIGAYPGALESIERHATIAGCDLDAVVSGDDLDVESTIDGFETGAQSWSEGCAEGVDFALWTVEGGSHIPTIQRDGTPQALEWLLAHDRTP
jgi:polyhydroxybutyrate depolymerase